MRDQSLRVVGHSRLLAFEVSGSEVAMWRMLTIFRPTTYSRGARLVDCKKGPTV
jgi:hypothetical protein